MQRTFVIGDIHGALKALQQVIGKAGPRPADRLIFLGDYVDGWSQSRQVIEYLMELDEKYDCIFLLGNHDAWCEEWLNGAEPNKDWLIHGGQATVASYKGLRPEEREKHIDFFERMLPYYEDGKLRLYIHAGFTSMHGPARDDYKTNYSRDRTLWEMALAVDSRIGKTSKLYPKRLLLYNEIYIGHTPTTNYDIDTPMKCCNVWNIDTGAAFQGRISVMDIATKEYWQSDIVPTLYPGEKGRNK